MVCKIRIVVPAKTLTGFRTPSGLIVYGLFKGYYFEKRYPMGSIPLVPKLCLVTQISQEVNVDASF